MGNEQDPAGAGSSSAAAVVTDSQARAATYPPPQPMPQQQAVPPPAYSPPNGPPPGPYSGPPPNYYAQQQPPLVVEGRPPLVSIISPEDAKKIRKMQWINFSCTMTQLICSLVIILLVRNNLTQYQVATTGNSGFINMECFAATSAFPSTCEYAYSLASVSIFFCFILSLMQCLTMDCCGMGRAVEAGFDAAACVWWIAGGITLGVRATEANALGIERMNERNAVVALCWISAFMFLALLVTNLVLIKRLGRAYKHAAQQMQQHMTAYPVGGVQMMPMGQNTGGYPQPGQFQQQQYGQPGGTGAYPPQPGMGAFNAPPPGSFPQQQQPPQWTAPPGYPTTPPTGHNAV
eukprot:GHUV01002376.1.p1 GENE.GHUV01002376.1~~GHUV01002376.1.p1  ORF type:complete len:348 (+),score=104.73 GHUV01002376.1:169-1212(+)